MLDLQVIGPVRLSGHDGSELHSILARPKLLGLLAYLAAAGPHGFVRRDAIVGVFWPDVDQDRARRSLRQSLYQLRGSLGESSIVSRGDEEVGLNAVDFRCDLWAFDQAVEQRDFVTALDLYDGDFLEGFGLSGLRDFEDWAAGRRRTVRERAARCALELAEQHVDDASQTAARARQAIKLAPLDEGLVQGVIRALDRAGDRAGAVRTYQEFSERMDRELAVEPSPESQALIDSIRDRAPPESVRTAGTADETSGEPADRSAMPLRRSAGGRILSEIRRRRVARVVVAYCFVALAALEAADIIAPRLQLPDWSVTLILVLLILGLPVVLALAWVFDIGPEGITRTPPSSAADPMPASRLGRAGELAVTAAAAALLVSAGAWLLVRDRDPVLEADRVLVAGLENQTGDPSLATLGSIALDWLTRGLQQTGAIRVIDARMLAADPLGYAAAGSNGVAFALNVARERAAGTLLSGAYYRQADSVYFQVHLTDVATGELRHSLDPIGGSIDQPLDVIEELRQRVMSTLAALAEFDLRTIPVKPPTYDAYQEFLTGLIMAAQGQSDAAMAHALTAAALDTSFAAPLLLASGEMIGSGQYARADSLLAVVNRKRGALSVPEQTALDGQLALLRGDLPAYLSAARRNDEIFGANLDQVGGLIWLNRPREAVELLARIDTTDVLSGGRPRYWRLLHDAYHILGEYEQALEAGRRARAKHPDNLGALQTDVATLGALGRTDELETRLGELAGLPWPRQSPIAEIVLEAIYELRAHGHTNAAQAMLEQLAGRMANLDHDLAQSPGARLRLVEVLSLAGQWDEARRQVETLIAAGSSGVEELAWLGIIAARQGDRESAVAVSEQLRGLDQRYLFGQNSIARARIAAALGERDRAVTLIRAAFSEGFRYDIALHRDIHFEMLRDYAAFLELMRPKEEAGQEVH